VIQIQMGIAQRVDELATAQAADLCHHRCQQRIAGDVERHAEEHIGAALI
jgi:hypothetical protein